MPLMPLGPPATSRSAVNRYTGCIVQRLEMGSSLLDEPRFVGARTGCMAGAEAGRAAVGRVGAGHGSAGAVSWGRGCPAWHE